MTAVGNRKASSIILLVLLLYRN